MPKTPATFSTKDRISHYVFGTGTISDVNDHHTTIVFDQGGARKFVTSMVKLERSDTPAPARVTRAKKKTTSKATAKKTAKKKTTSKATAKKTTKKTTKTTKAKATKEAKEAKAK